MILVEVTRSSKAVQKCAAGKLDSPIATMRTTALDTSRIPPMQRQGSKYFEGDCQSCCMVPETARDCMNLTCKPLNV